MTNIKQKILKYIISFACILLVSSCGSQNSSNNTTKKSSNITNVAILVPLSGENELIGKQYAGLIKTGLGAGAKSKIKVTSYDSSDELKLKESLKKILEQNTKIVIGPINSRDTKIVGNAFKDHDIVVMSLSNDPTLAEGNVFVFGHAPMRQMEQMSEYLLNNEYKNYLTLLPSGRHSTTISKIIQSMITTKEGSLNKMEFYSNDEELEKTISIISDNVDSLNEEETNLKLPVVLVGDDPESLKKLYKVAKKFNLDKKALIAGDNRLDIDSANQFDIIFTGSRKIDDGSLKQKATNLGINNFSFMHILCYDIGNIVAEYIGQHYNNEAFTAKLNGPDSFQGLSGRIYFTDGIAQRKYDIIRKKNGQYNVLATSAHSE